MARDITQAEDVMTGLALVPIMGRELADMIHNAVIGKVSRDELGGRGENACSLADLIKSKFPGTRFWVPFNTTLPGLAEVIPRFVQSDDQDFNRGLEALAELQGTETIERMLAEMPP